MKNLKFRGRRGFTLIELLVVVLILAVLLAIALPLYLGTISDSEAKTCKANKQTIVNAAMAYKTQSATQAWPANVAAMVTGGQLTTAPKCPKAGTISFTPPATAADLPSSNCTVHNDPFTP